MINYNENEAKNEKWITSDRTRLRHRHKHTKYNTEAELEKALVIK